MPANIFEFVFDLAEVFIRKFFVAYTVERHAFPEDNTMESQNYLQILPRKVSSF
jgi:hypothetical protein